MQRWIPSAARSHASARLRAPRPNQGSGRGHTYHHHHLSHLTNHHKYCPRRLLAHDGCWLLAPKHQRTLRVMAQSKRKCNSIRTKPSKRPKYVDSSGSELSGDKLWEADCILDEQIIRGIKRYHIKWKGTDPETGN